MGDLADKLLKMVEFFKLNDANSFQQLTAVTQLKQVNANVSQTAISSQSPQNQSQLIGV
jgi:hypothetical protein